MPEWCNARLLSSNADAAPINAALQTSFLVHLHSTHVATCLGAYVV